MFCSFSRCYWTCLGHGLLSTQWRYWEKNPSQLYYERPKVRNLILENYEQNYIYLEIYYVSILFVDVINLHFSDIPLNRTLWEEYVRKFIKYNTKRKEGGPVIVMLKYAKINEGVTTKSVFFIYIIYLIIMTSVVLNLSMCFNIKHDASHYVFLTFIVSQSCTSMRTFLRLIYSRVGLLLLF